jgi:hypothetical protein
MVNLVLAPHDLAVNLAPLRVRLPDAISISRLAGFIKQAYSAPASGRCIPGGMHPAHCEQKQIALSIPDGLDYRLLYAPSWNTIRMECILAVSCAAPLAFRTECFMPGGIQVACIGRYWPAEIQNGGMIWPNPKWSFGGSTGRTQNMDMFYAGLFPAVAPPGAEAVLESPREKKGSGFQVRRPSGRTRTIQIRKSISSCPSHPIRSGAIKTSPFNPVQIHYPGPICHRPREIPARLWRLRRFCHAGADAIPGFHLPNRRADKRAQDPPPANRDLGIEVTARRLYCYLSRLVA